MIIQKDHKTSVITVGTHGIQEVNQSLECVLTVAVEELDWT